MSKSFVLLDLRREPETRFLQALDRAVLGDTRTILLKSHWAKLAELERKPLTDISKPGTTPYQDPLFLIIQREVHAHCHTVWSRTISRLLRPFKYLFVK